MLCRMQDSHCALINLTSSWVFPHKQIQHYDKHLVHSFGDHDTLCYLYKHTLNKQCHHDKLCYLFVRCTHNAVTHSPHSNQLNQYWAVPFGTDHTSLCIVLSVTNTTPEPDVVREHRGVLGVCPIPVGKAQGAIPTISTVSNCRYA